MATKRKQKSKDELVNSQKKCMKHGFLEDVKAYIVQAGIGKARCELFKRHLAAQGGQVCSEYVDGHLTHIIVDDNMEIQKLCRIMKWEHPPGLGKCKIVRSLWLSHCLRDKCLLDSSSYMINMNTDVKTVAAEPKNEHFLVKKGDRSSISIKPSDVDDNQPSTSVSGENKAFMDTKEMNQEKLTDSSIKIRKYKKAVCSEDDADVESDYAPSGEDDDDCSSQKPASPPAGKQLPRGNWVCAHSSAKSPVNLNKHLTDKLQALAKTYENTNDKWRALGYSKAISILKNHPKEITTFEEAIALPGIGKRLADKIWEIIESGELRKLNELTSSEEIKAINLFTNIWGVGATTAQSWVAQNLRTLDDVREKANLTRVQRIGLRYYDELLDRMPRSEAAEIEQVVKNAAWNIDPDLICMACGSYRRGKSTCGDVDVLITHPDGRSHKGVFSKLLSMLRQSGFLTDDLVSHEENGNQKKYLGICRLPGEGRFHRRLDIIVVPYDEFACAIMYFTGSAHFNRSMRNLAGKMGMSLNEHGLFADVIRQNHDKLTKGHLLSTPDEASVFRHLGLTYRPPTERDH